MIKYVIVSDKDSNEWLAMCDPPNLFLSAPVGYHIEHWQFKKLILRADKLIKRERIMRS